MGQIISHDETPRGEMPSTKVMTCITNNRFVELLSSLRMCSLRFVATEAVGGMGDLGIFIAIVVGMVQIVHFDGASILLFAGLMHILAGLVFRLPMPVQPMKAIAALAIAGTLSAQQAGIAGLTVGLSVLLLGISGLTSWLDRIIPRAVLRGLQMAVAVELLAIALRIGLFDSRFNLVRPLWGTDSLLVFFLALTVILLFRQRMAWAVLVLVAIGFLLASFNLSGELDIAKITIWQPKWAFSDPSALWGIWLGGLPQIPLTVLNSVLAVSMLAGQLFPQHARRVTPAKVAVSVGLMNLIACPFGGMPICHGSGGLAAQYRCGARTSVSMVILGIAKLTIGLFFGSVAMAWMCAFPSSVLGALLVIAGIGLAEASRCWESRPYLLTAVVTVVVHQATGILLAGFLSGWLVFAFSLSKNNLASTLVRRG